MSESNKAHISTDEADIERRIHNRLQSKLMLSAIAGGNLEYVQGLLDSGADSNAVDKNGTSGIILASVNGHDGLLKLLLDRGADIDAKGYEGMTALMHASRFTRSTCVAMLLERGADATLTDDKGKTALVYCISKDIRRMLEDALLDHVLK